MSEKYIPNDLDEFYYNVADDDVNSMENSQIDSNKADALLYCITKERRKINKIVCDVSAQVSAIHEWRDSIVAKHEKAIDHMTTGLQEYFSRLVADDPKLRTRSFPNGVMNLRKQQPLLHIDDKDKFFNSLKNRANLTRVTEKVEPDKKKIMAQIKSTGEIPDGCRIEIRNDKFSVYTSTKTRDKNDE